MKKLILSILLSFFFFSCKEEPTKPQTETNLTLEVLDKSCTEVWIDVKANDQATKLGNVYLNDEFRTQFYLKDTLVYLDELMPNKTYTIKLTNQNGIGTQTEFTTMDTTSHNFTWETFTFGGEGGSSYLRDVAIINENDIWAVGEIYTKDTYTYDSNGVFQHPYNAVHWDGNEWELIRVGNSGYPRRTVFAFGESDVWFDGTIKWNGTEYKVYKEGFPLNPNGTGWLRNAMWGESSNNFYLVGNGGNIAHYNGSSWSKIESGTELDLYDIWGDMNEQTGEYEILAVGAKLLESTDRVILSIKSNHAEKINDVDITQPLSTVWFKTNRKYIVAGSGRYSKEKISQAKWSIKLKEITNYYTNRIRGNELNDLFIVGAYGNVMHYNGISWKSYLNKELPMINGNLLGLSQRGDLVLTVGSNDRKALIHLGYR
jgi:hypothetical protein